jgi:thiol-disulfide isomerase/thioredoxin
MKYLLYLTLAVALTACGDNSGSTQETLALDKLRGQWVVINYWAQWCKPCIAEIPELNALDQRYPQVAVRGVNYDGASGDELQRQIQTLGITFVNLATDPAEQVGAARPVALPTTLILNPAGQLTQTLVGPQTLESLARATGQIITVESSDKTEGPR